MDAHNVKVVPKVIQLQNGGPAVVELDRRLKGVDRVNPQLSVDSPSAWIAQFQTQTQIAPVIRRVKILIRPGNHRRQKKSSHQQTQRQTFSSKHSYLFLESTDFQDNPKSSEKIRRSLSKTPALKTYLAASTTGGATTALAAFA